MSEAPNPASKEEPTLFQMMVYPLGELLLTVLPLIVLAMVGLTLGKGWVHVIQSPEWAFGAAVLFGQTVFKLVAGVIKGGSQLWEEIGLIVVLVIVAGLVPSLVVLALRLTVDTPTAAMTISQSVLFLLSAIVFLVLGA